MLYRERPNAPGVSTDSKLVRPPVVHPAKSKESPSTPWLKGSAARLVSTENCENEVSLEGLISAESLGSEVHALKVCGPLEYDKFCISRVSVRDAESAPVQ